MPSPRRAQPGRGGWRWLRRGLVLSIWAAIGAALLLLALLAAWEIGSLVAAVSRSRRPARPLAAAGSANSPRAGMRLAALRPIRSRRRGPGAAGSPPGTPEPAGTPLASPFDPMSSREVEPTTTGGRR